MESIPEGGHSEMRLVSNAHRKKVASGDTTAPRRLHFRGLHIHFSTIFAFQYLRQKIAAVEFPRWAGPRSFNSFLRVTVGGPTVVEAVSRTPKRQLGRRLGCTFIKENRGNDYEFLCSVASDAASPPTRIAPGRLGHAAHCLAPGLQPAWRVHALGHADPALVLVAEVVAVVTGGVLLLPGAGLVRVAAVVHSAATEHGERGTPRVCKLAGGGLVGRENVEARSDARSDRAASVCAGGGWKSRWCGRMSWDGQESGAGERGREGGLSKRRPRRARVGHAPRMCQARPD